MPEIVLVASVARRGRVRLPGVMNRDQKTVAAVVRKFMVLTFEFFEPAEHGLTDAVMAEYITIMIINNKTRGQFLSNSRKALMLMYHFQTRYPQS